MNRLPATFHRLSIALIALALIAVGGGAIAWRASIDRYTSGSTGSTRPRSRVPSHNRGGMWVLVAVAVVAVGVGDCC